MSYSDDDFPYYTYRHFVSVNGGPFHAATSEYIDYLIERGIDYKRLPAPRPD